MVLGVGLNSTDVGEGINDVLLISLSAIAVGDTATGGEYGVLVFRQMNTPNNPDVFVVLSDKHISLESTSIWPCVVSISSKETLVVDLSTVSRVRLFANKLTMQNTNLA
jgi:hypothetical protein